MYDTFGRTLQWNDGAGKSKILDKDAWKLVWVCMEN